MKGSTMKNALICTNKEIKVEVDQRFGRSAYFLLYQLNDDSFEFIKNTQQIAPRNSEC